MRKRSENWRDLLAAYTLAFDAKKLFVGFIAIVCTVFVVWAMSMVYGLVDGAMDRPAESVVQLGQVKAGADSAWELVREGEGAEIASAAFPLLNPFHNMNVLHFALSIITYILLFGVWTRYGGIISRLTVLEYAKDDLPTLREAREAVGGRWKDYWLAPVMPLMFIVVLTAMNALAGLVASIPVLGRILLIFPGFPMLLITSLIITLLAVLGTLSFGMMMPGISAGGKDGFDAFATAYAYVIWGLRKFILFSLILIVVGGVATLVVTELIELLIEFLRRSVELGFIGGASPLTDAAGGWGDKWFHAILMGLLVPVHAIAAAYVFSYYFTGNTIMFFLLRKDQDNIDIDEIYEELEEEDFGELEVPEGAEVAEAAEPEEEAEEAAEEAEQEEEEEEEAEAEDEPEEETEPEEEVTGEEETVPDEDLASEQEEEEEEDKG